MLDENQHDDLLPFFQKGSHDEVTWSHDDLSQSECTSAQAKRRPLKPSARQAAGGASAVHAAGEAAGAAAAVHARYQLKIAKCGYAPAGLIEV